jgi:uncharacterized protein YkwD
MSQLISLILAFFVSLWTNSLEALDYNLNQEKLFRTINEYRISTGTFAYVEDEMACKAAEIRLQEVTKNYSHDGFDADRFCAGNCKMGENLSAGIYSESKLLRLWLASPLHRKNLEDNYKYSCIRANQEYAVHIFANYE